jgi:hydrogenase nickel incorporation protein HypB
MDLAAAVEFDSDVATKNITAVRPGMPIIRVSSKTGQGMDDWLGFLESRRRP